MKYTIPFTRFNLPNGRQSHDETDVGDTEYAAYQKVVAAGLRMTIELLSNGAVSMCIEDPEIGDFDIEVCSNGPAVPEKLSEMLLRFDPTKVEEWRTIMTG